MQFKNVTDRVSRSRLNSPDLKVRGRVASPMVSLVVAARLGRLNEQLAACLEGKGWNVQRLATLEGCEPEELQMVLEGLDDDAGPGLFGRRDLQELVVVCHRMAEISWQAEGSTNGAELLEAGLMARSEADRAERKQSEREMIMKTIVRKGKAKMVKWPTRLGKLLAVAGDNAQLRQTAEETERLRWIEELRKIMVEAKLPAVEAEEWHGVPTLRIGKGRRASTLRKHVKTWWQVREWLMASFSIPWPKVPGHLALYLEARAAEPCGRSVPTSVYKTFMFMEFAGEVGKEDQMQNDLALKNALEEINLRLETVELRDRKQAMHVPTRMVEAWEEATMDEALPRFVRGYAWFKLVKLWGAMRYSDTTGVRMQTAEMDKVCWSADLTRTKTTGPGKKVRIVKVFISKHAYLRKHDWLATGWRLWKDMAWEANLENRDFMLTTPREDLDGMERKMASYAAASAMTQAMSNHLLAVDGDEYEQLLEQGVASCWTEHSERVTLRTWARSSGVEEDVCKRMGRWTPTVDQSYDRAVRVQILQAQIKIAGFVSENIGRQDPFDEDKVLERVAEKMEAVGYEKDKIDLQVTKLKSFYEFGPPTKRRKQGERPLDPWEEKEPAGEEAEEIAAELERSDSADESITEEEQMNEEKPRLVTQGSYVVSTVGRSNRKTLHRVGECHRVPGIHFSNFEVIGDNPPEPELYHHACMICFPRGAVQEEPETDGSSSGDVSSSDTESGEKEE